jgi:hypothetical protein
LIEQNEWKEIPVRLALLKEFKSFETIGGTDRLQSPVRK